VAVEQAFASDELKLRLARAMPRPASTSVISNCTVALHGDVRLARMGAKMRSRNVILGVVLAAESDERFGGELFQRDGFQRAKGCAAAIATLKGKWQQFKLDTCGLLAEGPRP